MQNLLLVEMHPAGDFTFMQHIKFRRKTQLVLIFTIVASASKDLNISEVTLG
jgi:hypothetical protein